MSDSFFVNAPFNITQDTSVYSHTLTTPNTYDYIFTINTYNSNSVGYRFPSMNELFSTRLFQQSNAGEYSIGENKYDVNIQLNASKLESLLYSNDCVMINSIQTSVVNNNAFGTLDTSSDKLLGLRFLEVVATKIFGHARARAAIENDQEFYKNTAGSLIKQISDGVQSGFNSKKNDIFNMYVSFDRIEDNKNDDVNAPCNFNFQHTSWEFPICLKSTLVGSGDMTKLNLGPDVGGNRLTLGSMAVPILLKFITNNYEIPLFTLLGLEFINSLVNDFSISINSLGNRIAVGLVNNATNSGIVRAYEYKYSSWTQLGDDIVGALSGDKSGYSISMNDIGDCIAIGAPNNNGYNGTNTGQVRVYKLNVKTASPLEYKWDKLGQDIEGALSNLLSGYSVSMNSLGNCIAIGSNNTNSGCIRTYICVNNIWLKLGADLDTEYIGITSKYLVNMNSLGNRIAVGTINSGVGCVKVYEYNSASYSWVKLGTNMLTTLGDSKFSVSINGLGDRVVVGYNSTLGSIKIYNYVSTDWVAMTQIINLLTNNLCYSVSIDSTGNRITVGAVNSNTKLGNTILYKYESGQWNESLNIIDTVVNDSLKYSVNMSDSGNYIAQGAVYSSDGSCHVKVLQITDTSTYTPISTSIYPTVFQLSNDIDGLAAGDKSGYCVSTNAYGNIVAIASPYANTILDTNGVVISRRGQVRVFIYNTQSSSWEQLGGNINGDAGIICNRISLKMNASGNCIILGFTHGHNPELNLNTVGEKYSLYTRVYTYSSIGWEPLGQDIIGPVLDGENIIFENVLGYSVSMNKSGNCIAVGDIMGSSYKFDIATGVWTNPNGIETNLPNTGNVHVYKYNITNNLWELKWFIVPITTGTEGSCFGSSITMNDSGDRIAIGQYRDMAKVSVFDLFNDGTYTQVGQYIPSGESETDWANTICMNSIGNRIIIGSPQYKVNGVNNQCGVAKIYELNGDTWVYLGQNIKGIEPYGKLGFCVSMNDIGDRIAVSATGYYTGTVTNTAYNSTKIGHTMIYKLEIINGVKTWTEIINITGEADGDKSGICVSMNAYGDRVAIGAYNNDGGGINSGHVRVYQTTDVITYNTITLSLFPNITLSSNITYNNIFGFK
jgi:hypothetical protein